MKVFPMDSFDNDKNKNIPKSWPHEDSSGRTGEPCQGKQIEGLKKKIFDLEKKIKNVSIP